MPREVEPSLNERQFIRDALFESIRLDGRQLDQYRNLELEFGDDYGVADVRLGKTRCVMTIQHRKGYVANVYTEWLYVSLQK